MLDNKMVIDQIDLYKLVGTPEYISVTQEEYDLIQKKDPTAIYIISDTPGRMYIGDNLLEKEKPKNTYLLGPSNQFGEYILYLNHPDDWVDHLLEISRYSNPQQAIDALNKFNRVGSHVDSALQTFNLIVCYIQSEITLHELLIGIISLFGYRDDIRLQQVIERATTYDVTRNSRDFSPLMREEIPSWKNDENYLFTYYSDLYDVIVKHNHFKGREFHVDPEELNLSNVINDIIKVIIELIIPPR